MSDIHGNLTALQAVKSALPPHDQVVVAGDLCLDGPHPAQVLDLLLDAGWALIMGNTDRDLVEPAADEKEGDIEEWTREQLGDERLQILASLPFSTRLGTAEEGTALVVHANPKTMDDHLRPDMPNDEIRPFLEGVEAEILAFGHYHVPYVRKVDDVTLVDVSSVGHPKDRDRRAAFTLLEWQDGRRAITQFRVPYDVDRTVAAIKQSGMPRAEKQAAALLRASYAQKS